MSNTGKYVGIAAGAAAAGLLAYVLLAKKDTKPLLKYWCPYDGTGFPTLADLNEHVRVAHPDIVYTCPYDGETFTTQALLAEHLLAEHPDEPVVFVCPHDGISFPTQAELDEHIRIEHPSDIFTCPYDQLTFTTLDELNAHIENKHGGEIPSGTNPYTILAPYIASKEMMSLSGDVGLMIITDISIENAGLFTEPSYEPL